MSPARPLLKPVAARIEKVVAEGSAGHSLWLAPRQGWSEPPTPGQFLMLWLPRPPAAADPGSGGAPVGEGGSPTAGDSQNNRVAGDLSICDSVPMSVAGWEPGRLMVTVADLGPTTHALLQCREGELLGVTGPLGRGFDWSGRQNLLLVAGGVGAPPLRYLAQRAAAGGLRVHTILGARTEQALFNRADLERFSDKLHLATDDGSAGHHGPVTDLLEPVAATLAAETGSGKELLCGCGPEPMLVKVLEWAEARQPEPLATQLCLERHMGCGVGVCGVCTVDELLVCHDGPVLTGEQLRDSREFGRVVRGPGGRLVR